MGLNLFWYAINYEYHSSLTVAIAFGLQSLQPQSMHSTVNAYILLFWCFHVGICLCVLFVVVHRLLCLFVQFDCARQVTLRMMNSSLCSLLQNVKVKRLWMDWFWKIMMMLAEFILGRDLMRWSCCKVSLFNGQRACVREVGFGGLLDLDIRDTPSQLGHWLVDNFDARSQTLKLASGQGLHITRHDVDHYWGTS